jgi:hypothetical protein
MYSKPMLEPFGTFRELTRQGSSDANDLLASQGNPTDGCNPNGNSENTMCPPGFTTS